MKRVRWSLEESCVLFDFYFKHKLSYKKEDLDFIVCLFNKRADYLGIERDEKYRNYAGLSMQLACIEYVVTDGTSGLTNASKLFYKTFDVYKNDRRRFESIVNEFYQQYQ